MCGKGMSQTSQQTALPSFGALSAYNTAMDKISAATSQPFQKYSSDPNAYVAPLTGTQQGAISNITGMAGMTDPYFQGATGLTMAGAGPVGRLTGEQIGEYMSPYMSQVVDPVRAGLEQKFGQQLSQQQADAIKAGAFGGTRSDVARALLQGQQGLALGQALSPLYQTGYGQALQTAQGQQAVEAANLQRLLGAGAQIGGLGTAAQNAALQQAQAQLQAGTLQQQTQTAQLQALYNEFQKQRMYPLQTAQLYAQTTGALGPLMGTTQMGYQQLPFFGGLMADGGSVDKYGEGLGRARMGGAVDEAGDYARGGYAYGGEPGFEDIVAQHRAALGLGRPVEDISFPTGEFHTGPAPTIGVMPERRQSGLNLSSMADVAKRGIAAKQAYDNPNTSKWDVAKSFLSGDFSPAKADGGEVSDDGMQQLLNSPIQTSKPLTAQATEQKKSGLGGLLKAGASMAANAYLPGSGALVSGGLSALGMADGGRAGYADGGGDDMDYYLRPLARIETGGEKDPYSAIGPATKYGRALGKYQIMEGNVPEWTKAALGRAMTRDEFLGNREAQEATARHRFGQYLDKAGTPESAAAMWFGGPGYAKHMNARDVLGTSIPQYQAMYKKGLGGADFDIPKGDPRRELVAEYPPRPTTETPGPAAGLGSAQVKDKGFLERTQEHPESLILPVLQGLGAMAGSKSKYLGSAILEGLGAGAGSYMDMQQKMADIAKRQQEAATEAETTGLRKAQTGVEEATGREITGRAAKASLIIGANGLPTGATVYDPKTGGYRYMDFGELYRNRESVNLLPQEVALVEQAATTSGGAAPAGAPPSPPAPTARSVEVAKEVAKTPGEPAPAPAAGGLTPVPKMFSVGPEDKKKVAEQLNTLVGTDISGQEKFFRDQEAISSGAATQKPLSAELATAFSRLPTTGPLAPGAAQPKVASIAEWVNSLANIAGFKGPVNQADLATLDQINKLTAQLKTAATASNDQRALGALAEFEKMFPTGKATRGGIAKNLSAILMMNQKELDKIHYFDDWKRTAAGINPTLAAASGAMANTTFNEKYNAQYDKEVKQIEKMLMTDVPGAKDPQTNRPMNWFTYLSEHGGELSPAEKKLVESKFGDGILRYFPSVQR